MSGDAHREREAVVRFLRRLGEDRAADAIRAGEHCASDGAAVWRRVPLVRENLYTVWLLEQPRTGEPFADLAAAATGSARVTFAGMSGWHWSATHEDRAAENYAPTRASAQADAEAQLRAWDALPGGAR